jgi:hypothetical protein
MKKYSVSKKEEFTSGKAKFWYKYGEISGM